MQSKVPALEASKRDRLGSRYSKRVRATGSIPAVIYGHKRDPLPVTIDQHTISRHLQKGFRIFDVKVGGGSETCLVKDLQYDHLGNEIIHVDLARIDLNEEVSVRVRLSFLGTPIGMKTSGAVFRAVSDNLHIRCKAMDIPSEAIPIDVSGLEANKSISAGDVKLPPAFKLDEDPHHVVCQIDVVAEVVVAAPTAEAAAAAAAPVEPEVITEKAAADRAKAKEEKEK